jgi:hypothetical protein
MTTDTKNKFFPLLNVYLHSKRIENQNIFDLENLDD